jgi:hypothetical protein
MNVASPIRAGKHIVSKETLRKSISALRRRALQGEPSAVVAIVQLRGDIADISDAGADAASKAE